MITKRYEGSGDCIAESALVLVGRASGGPSVGIVYMARNKVNGKCYVGKTMLAMEVRRWGHESRARKGGGYLFHNALRKYGFGAFVFKVLIDNVDDEGELNCLEQSVIRSFKSKAPSGYNLTDGGEGVSGG